jgi:hypothetical protein
MIAKDRTPVGEMLIKLVHGDQTHFFWTSRKLGNPRFMDFVVAHADGDVADVARPLVFKTCFSIAVDVVSLWSRVVPRTVDIDCTLSVALHGAAESGRLSRAKVLGEGEVTRLLTTKQIRPVVDVDPLDEAMRLATSRPRKKPWRKRLRKKQPGAKDSGSEVSNSSGAGEADESSEASAEHVFGEDSVAPELAIAASPKPDFSCFYGATGVTACHLEHPGRAKCRVCSEKIRFGNARLVWQWHTSRPHACLHSCCAHRLEVGVLSRALGIMEAAVKDPKATPSLIDDLERGMRLAMKRLPQARRIL